MANSTFSGSVILPVAADTVSHIQDTRLVYLPHIAHIAMASHTFKSTVYMGFMKKAYVVRHSVYSHPIDDLFVEPRTLHISYSGSGYPGLLSHYLVAEHTLLNRRHCSSSSLSHVAVAKDTVDLVILYVRDVTKGYGLDGTGTGYNLAVDENSTNYNDY